jgi:chitodextrinase
MFMIRQELRFRIKSLKPFSCLFFTFVFSAGITSASEWRTSKFYEIGNIVRFLGSEYVAVSTSRGVEPSLDSLLWEKRAVLIGDARTPTYPVWSVDTVYETTKTTVSHNGKLWENSSWTVAEEPGMSGVLVWREVALDFEDAKKYKNDVLYRRGVVVSWDGRLWEAAFDTLGGEPGVGEVWILKGYQGVFSAKDSRNNNELPSANGKWDDRTSYLAIDTLISHSGLLWKNSQPAMPGEEPGEAGGSVWYLVGVVNHSQLSRWSSDVTYKATQAIQFSDYTWVSRRETSGQQPGRSSDWILAQPIVALLQTWSPSQRFEAGTMINYGGYHWTAMEGNVAIEPGQANSTKVWLRASSRLLSGVFSYRDWNARDKYPSAGMLVNFSNTYWVSIRSIFLGEHPGVSNAWERVGQSLGGEGIVVVDAIQQTNIEWMPNKAYPVAGTVVTYKGLEYRSRISVAQGGLPPVANPVYWEILSKGVWDINRTYDKGDIVVSEHMIYQAISPITGGPNPSTAPNRWKVLGRSTESFDLDNIQYQTKPMEDAVWQQNEIYDSPGIFVTYNNRKWRNISRTRNDIPGMTSVWQPETITDGEPWNRYFIYESERVYTVIYDGVAYKSKGRSLGDIPETSSLWIKTDDEYIEGALWQADLDYVNINSFVNHNGRVWYNLQPSKNQEPGQSSIWQPVEITDGEQWNSYFLYDGRVRGEGERFYKVAFNDQIWINRSRTIGDTPGDDFHWEPVSLSNDYVWGETWSADQEYVLIDRVVTYPGGSDQRWMNTTRSKGEVPGSSVTWQPMSIDFGSPWSQWIIYDGTNRGFPEQRYVVSYEGKLWQNTQYSLGHVPGLHKSWEMYEVADSVWSPDIYYSVGASVRYDSKGDGSNEVWFSAYPNIGTTPGGTDAWEQPYTPNLGWNLRVNYKVGDTVTYKKKIWKAQYTNVGFEPGISDAWSVPYADGAAWDADVVYQKDNDVVYEGRIWFANYYSSNDRPDSGSGAWRMQYLEGAAWSPYVVYQTGNTVEHGGGVWLANYYSLSDPPDLGSGAWRVQYVEGAVWSRYVVYQAGNAVEHGGGVWLANYYSLSDPPDLGSGAWRLQYLEGAAWDSRAAPYDEGMTVSHSGSSWRAKWWAGSDDVPGVSPAWELLSLQ